VCLSIPHMPFHMGGVFFVGAGSQGAREPRVTLSKAPVPGFYSDGHEL